MIIAKPFTDYTAADYATAVEVDLSGFFWLTQRAIAEMARRYGGHVVNITATLAEAADSGTPAMLAASIFLDILNVFLFFLQIFSREQ